MGIAVMILRFSMGIVTVALLCCGAEVLACTNCVSDDPLSESSGGNWRVYAGFSRTTDFSLRNSNGEDVDQFGLESRNTTTVALGHALSSDAFVTLTAPYLVNRKGSNQRSGWGDALLTGRYTIYNQDSALDWMPQIQGVLAYMDGRATSVYNYQDPAALEVFGAGVPQWRAGLDAWHGTQAWKGGLTVNFSGPTNSTQTEFGSLRNGLTVGVKVTGGFGYGDRQRVLCGVNYERTSGKTLGGVLAPNSESQGITGILTGEAQIAHNIDLQLSLQKVAESRYVKNFSRSNSVTAAIIRTY